MRSVVISCLLATAACSSHEERQAALKGAWTWEGTDCAERRYEFTDDVIRAVLPGENTIMYKILETHVGEGNPPEITLDLQLLPQAGMSATDVQFLKETGGIHSMSFKVEGRRLLPLTLSMSGNSTRIEPGEPTYDEFNLHRCADGAVT
jgi:hypothetical protein